MHASEQRPRTIELLQKSRLMKICWHSGGHSEIAFSLLRQFCACSQCRAHNIVGQPRNLNNTDITHATPIGSTGLQLAFSDGHQNGIYPWGYLHAIGQGRGIAYFNEC